MVSETSEKALEDLIEAAFLREVEGEPTEYIKGNNADFDADLAMDTVQLWAFLEATQPD